MARNRTGLLLDKLLANELTQEELDEFLAGVGTGDRLAEYSGYLKQYFDELTRQEEQHKQPGLRNGANGSSTE